jgi:hypothetical protein
VVAYRLNRALKENTDASTQDDARLESALPVVTALAFRIQHEYNALMALVSASAERENEDEEDEDAEMELGDKEFVISELLKLAVNLDYADETGRRKMFALIRRSRTYYAHSVDVRSLSIFKVIWHRQNCCQKDSSPSA